MAKTNILIVEDEYITALDIRIMLILKGYNSFDIVSTAKEAIKIATTDRIDLVLMDIKLKGKMDGIEAARQIQEKTDIPIIFISGNTSLLESDRLKAVNPAGIIKKPITEYNLEEALKKALS